MDKIEVHNMGRSDGHVRCSNKICNNWAEYYKGVKIGTIETFIWYCEDCRNKFEKENPWIN